MAKKSLHPEWHNTKVFCDGKLILEVGTTKKELYVDIWSGNHPFYTGSQKNYRYRRKSGEISTKI